MSQPRRCDQESLHYSTTGQIAPSVAARPPTSYPVGVMQLALQLTPPHKELSVDAEFHLD
jgi:hypothetical protein